MESIKVISEVIFILGMLFFVFWRKDIVLYLINFPFMLGAGFAWYNTFDDWFGLIVCGLLIVIGVYSLALGIINILKGNQQ